ncbi:MAG: hypothetical protein AAF573_03365 [Bacteroidota bacterium]
MYKVILFALSVLFLSNCKSINLRKDTATNQLYALKNGVLLVRLSTNEAKIKRLIEMKKPAAAKREKARIYQFHQDILRAFAAHFTFCPVYFYYSDSSKEVQAGRFDGHLFDAQQQPVTDVSFPEENRYFGEFGFVHQQEITTTEDGEVVKIAGTAGQKAFVIRTHEGIQPRKPFPYATNYTSSITKKDGIKNAITKINHLLFERLNRMERRRMRRKRKSNG